MVGRSPALRSGSNAVLRVGKGGVYQVYEDVVYSGNGHAFNILRAEKLVRVAQQLERSIFYLYSSRAAAMEGREEGGCGFIVQQKPPEGNHVFASTQYAVTANHVIREHFCPVIRLSTVDGGTDTIELAINQWKPHPDGYDLAAADLGFIDQSRFTYRTLGRHILLSQGDMEMLDVGLGDDVYMVGRFVHHDGGQKNRPSARSGIISVMADMENKIAMPNEPEQEAFLVEMRSVCGYSGSPVIFHLPSIPDSWKINRQMTLAPDTAGNYTIGPWLLGVDVGAFSFYNKIYATRKEQKQEIVTEVEGYEVKSHAGQSIVIPAWRLAELLDLEEFVMARQERIERVRQFANQHPVEKHAANDEERELTRSGFEEALRKASLKISEPVSAASERESEPKRTSD